MAGTVITILEKTDIDFGSPAAGFAVGETPVAQDVDVSRYKEITMLVRLHNNGMTSTGAKIIVGVKSVLPSAEDPGQNFRVALTSQDVNKVDLNGTLYRTPIAASGNAGAMLSFFISGNSGAGQTLPLKATISIALSLKE